MRKRFLRKEQSSNERLFHICAQICCYVGETMIVSAMSIPCWFQSGTADLDGGPTSDVAAGGNHSSALEVLVGLRVHHQQPGLVAACFDEGHDVRVLHGLDVDPVDLERFLVRPDANLGNKTISLLIALRLTKWSLGTVRSVS